MIDRYEHKSGNAFDHARFHRALARYKIGAIGEMFFRRYLEGNSDDPMYPKMEDQVPVRVKRALDVVEGTEDRDI